jgi:hypothetical protein
MLAVSSVSATRELYLGLPRPYLIFKHLFSFRYIFLLTETAYLIIVVEWLTLLPQTQGFPDLNY